MKRLLWIGDAACPSGFAKCTHGTLEVLRKYWEVQVLGINYRGDPHPYPYKIWPAFTGGDVFGTERLAELCDNFDPDVIVIQNDPWNIPGYVKTVPNRRYVGSIAVDGKNCRGRLLNQLELAIFWTDFGLREARAGGYIKPGFVVPLGVDLVTFQGFSRQIARERMGLAHLKDAFIVGNINRNQHRKRLDLTIFAFAKWVNEQKISDAYLFLHIAPTGDLGVECQQLADYFGVGDRLILVTPDVFKGVSEDRLVDTYNCFDVQINTAQGEGWGLTTMEGMACGVPQIVPDWAALGEWPGEAVIKVPCTSIAAAPNFVNTIGGIVNVSETARALHRLYTDVELREKLRHRGLSVVQQPQYRWENIGERFAECIAEQAEEASA